MRIIIAIITWNPHQKYLPSLIKHFERHGFTDIVLCGGHGYKDYPYVECSDEYLQMYKRYVLVNWCKEHYNENDLIWFMDEDDCPLLYKTDVPLDIPDTYFKYKATFHTGEKILREKKFVTMTLSNYIAPVKYYSQCYDYLLNNNWLTIWDFQNTHAMEDTLIMNLISTKFEFPVKDLDNVAFIHINNRSSSCINKDNIKNMELVFRNYTKVYTAMSCIFCDFLKKIKFKGNLATYTPFGYYLILIFLNASDKEVPKFQKYFDMIIKGLCLYVFLRIDKTILDRLDNVSILDNEYILPACLSGLWDIPEKYKEPQILLSNLHRYEYNIPKVEDCFCDVFVKNYKNPGFYSPNYNFNLIEDWN